MKYLILSVAVFAGCSSLTPEQTQSLVDFANMQVADGMWTREQADAFLDALVRSEWNAVIETLSAAALGILGSLTGVRLWRGGVTSRKGLAPK